MLLKINSGSLKMLSLVKIRRQIYISSLFKAQAEGKNTWTKIVLMKNFMDNQWTLGNESRKRAGPLYFVNLILVN